MHTVGTGIRGGDSRVPTHRGRYVRESRAAEGWGLSFCCVGRCWESKEGRKEGEESVRQIDNRQGHAGLQTENAYHLEERVSE